MRITEYRVVETSTVTDDSLSRILNDETRQGWVFDGMTFVPNEASKRPRMAFVIFTRERDVGPEQSSIPNPLAAADVDDTGPGGFHALPAGEKDTAPATAHALPLLADEEG
jgi:hypothetical protein